MSADNPRRRASSLIAAILRSATVGSAPAPETGLMIATIDTLVLAFLPRSMRKNLAIVASHHHLSGGCMKSLAVRLMLLAVFIVASGIAGYIVWTSESHVRN